MRDFLATNLKAFFDNKIVSFVKWFFPPITGAYYLFLDVMDDKFSWIVNYPNFHKWMFFTCIIVTLLGSFFYALNVKLNENESDYAESLINCLEQVVELKKMRLLKKIKDLRKGDDFFSKITLPDEQINQSCTHYATLISNLFDVKQRNVDITIIDFEESSFFVKMKTNAEHTSFKKLLREKSAAKACMESGGSLLVMDKEKEAKNGDYYLSASDKRNLPGSAFCYAVKINEQNLIANFVITVSTYGKRFDSNGKFTRETIELVLRNIAARIELELHLEFIKRLRKKQQMERPVTAMPSIQHLKRKTH